MMKMKMIKCKYSSHVHTETRLYVICMYKLFDDLISSQILKRENT